LDHWYEYTKPSSHYHYDSIVAWNRLRVTGTRIMETGQLCNEPLLPSDSGTSKLPTTFRNVWIKDGRIDYPASLVSCTVKWKLSSQIEEGIDGKRIEIADSAAGHPPGFFPCRVLKAEEGPDLGEAYLVNCTVKWPSRTEMETIDDIDRIKFELKPRRARGTSRSDSVTDHKQLKYERKTKPKPSNDGKVKRTEIVSPPAASKIVEDSGLPGVVERCTSDDGKTLTGYIVFNKGFSNFEDAFLSSDPDGKLGWSVGMHDTGDGGFYLLASQSVDVLFSERIYEFLYVDERDTPYCAGVYAEKDSWKHYTWDGDWCKIHKAIKMDILKGHKYKLQAEIGSELDQLHQQHLSPIKLTASQKQLTKPAKLCKDTLNVCRHALRIMSWKVFKEWNRQCSLHVHAYGTILETTTNGPNSKPSVRELASSYQKSPKGEGKIHAEELLFSDLARQLRDNRNTTGGDLHMVLVLIHAAPQGQEEDRDAWGGSMCPTCTCALAQFHVQEGLLVNKLKVICPTEKRANGTAMLAPITVLMNAAKSRDEPLNVLYINSKMNDCDCFSQPEEVGQAVSSVVKKLVHGARNCCWKHCPYFEKSTKHVFQKPSGHHVSGEGRNKPCHPGLGWKRKEAPSCDDGNTMLSNKGQKTSLSLCEMIASSRERKAPPSSSAFEAPSSAEQKIQARPISADVSAADPPGTTFAAMSASPSQMFFSAPAVPCSPAFHATKKVTPVSERTGSKPHLAHPIDAGSTAPAVPRRTPHLANSDVAGPTASVPPPPLPKVSHTKLAAKRSKLTTNGPSEIIDLTDTSSSDDEE